MITHTHRCAHHLLEYTLQYTTTPPQCTIHIVQTILRIDTGYTDKAQDKRYPSFSFSSSHLTTQMPVPIHGATTQPSVVARPRFTSTFPKPFA